MDIIEEKKNSVLSNRSIEYESQLKILTVYLIGCLLLIVCIPMVTRLVREGYRTAQVFLWRNGYRSKIFEDRRRENGGKKLL